MSSKACARCSRCNQRADRSYFPTRAFHRATRPNAGRGFSCSVGSRMAGMKSRPRGRWFSFSLRTLFFLVTMACFPLAWHAYYRNWVDQRYAVLTSTGSDGLRLVYGDPFHDAQETPFILRFYGEMSCQTLFYSPELDADEIARIQRLFPESTLMPMWWRSTRDAGPD
jgi:hypothetical protein